MGRKLGPIAGPQGKGSNAGGKPGRGANSPRVAPQLGKLEGGSTSRKPIAPWAGKP